MRQRALKHFRCIAALAALLALAGCGGGGGGGSAAASPAAGSGSGSTSGNTSGWIPGNFLPSSTYAAQCVSPRSGTDPETNQPYPDVQGTVLDQNNWLRSWSNELYLWYDEIVDRDPSLYSTSDYFGLLKTTATTASGNPKDKFHFTYPTDQWIALAQSGTEAGYGAQWVVIPGTASRRIVVAYTEPGSPAVDASANLARGAEVLLVDGMDVNTSTQAGIGTLNAGLFPSQAGETHTFEIRDLGSTTTRMVTMQSAIVTSTPVLKTKTLSTSSGTVGYLLFTDHVATAEQELIDSVTQLKADGITDLVLDLRYNGGGLLDIASELAYMIAGPVPTAGQTFENIVFNDKNPATNPVTGQPLQPIPFHTTALGFSATAGQALPTLNLSRVFVLTGPNTCSASESIINSLRGVGVEVIQIGSTTCGKPYGFYPQDNCGTTYFTIEFKGVNAQGFGDYTDGFSPSNTVGGGTPVPGCSVADDFTHALGDPAETRLATALANRAGQSCPAPTGTAAPKGLSTPMSVMPALDSADGRMYKSPWLENRSLSGPP